MYRAAMISQLIALSIKGKFTDVFVCQVSFSYNLSQVTGFFFLATKDYGREIK